MIRISVAPSETNPAKLSFEKKGKILWEIDGATAVQSKFKLTCTGVACCELATKYSRDDYQF